jgi:hypothetical protein
MRTQEEIDAKISEIYNDINEFGDNNERATQLEVLEAGFEYNDVADRYEDDPDSFIHQAAETARQWMDGNEWFD